MANMKQRYGRKITAFTFENIVRCNTTEDQHQFALAISKLVARLILRNEESRRLILGGQRRDQSQASEERQ